ncbi:MAG: hypothetical protein ACUVS2_02990 [Candidatus Flexifilum sp.]
MKRSPAPASASIIWLVVCLIAAMPLAWPPGRAQAQAEPTPLPLSLDAAEALPTVLAARSDLELLADQAFGRDSRPPGWNGSLNASDPQLPLLVRLDLENMAGQLLSIDERPAGWFGIVVSSPRAIARDLRHDLELLADLVMGTSALRPAGWRGDDPIMRCGRAAQALVGLLGRSGFTVNLDFNQPGACDQLEIEVSRFVETTIITPPTVPQVGSAEGAIIQGSGQVTVDPFRVESPFVAAFGDRLARQRLGVIPVGTGFRPVARSYATGSNMMLIRGLDFQVYVDYTVTPVSRNEFLALPNVDMVGGTISCNAAWCEGS